jgi:hypothetical protein
MFYMYLYVYIYIYICFKQPDCDVEEHVYFVYIYVCIYVYIFMYTYDICAHRCKVYAYIYVYIQVNKDKVYTDEQLKMKTTLEDRITYLHISIYTSTSISCMYRLSKKYTPMFVYRLTKIRCIQTSCLRLKVLLKIISLTYI